ncbi:hypothetical protein [Saccharothrix luteola]|uniref:hypothetical protein n=1 Tax=Saccharothrix luteola TaxID=2893018 RepID=UPI001E3FDB90|nr:hypothetical protein [Saccharothrix luteola]MCC8245500.1 hypothetical protein [Saccharothrix luteola]
MIENAVEQLVIELKRLRQRRGLDSPDLTDAIGHALADSLGLDLRGGPARLREVLRHKLTELAEQLPDEPRRAVLIAYGLTAESASTTVFTQRAKLFADLIDRDPRTAVRRIDQASRMLAKAMLALRRAPGDEHSAPPWFTTSLHTSVVLDNGLPQIYEKRRIVVSADKLEEIELQASVPVPPDWKGGLPPESTHIEVLHGGTLQARRRRSSARLGYVLRLPHKLPRDAEHEFFLRFRFTEENSMRPFYTCTPVFPCALFDLHVKFAPERVPDRIWRITGLPQSEVEDQLAPREPVKVDACGEVHLRFTGLTPNRSFGIAWSEDVLSEDEAASGAARAV